MTDNPRNEFNIARQRLHELFASPNKGIGEMGRIIQDVGRPEIIESHPQTQQQVEFLLREIQERIIAKNLELPPEVTVFKIFEIANGFHGHIPEMRPDPKKTSTPFEQAENAKSKVAELEALFMPRYRQLLVSEMGSKEREYD